MVITHVLPKLCLALSHVVVNSAGNIIDAEVVNGNWHLHREGDIWETQTESGRVVTTHTCTEENTRFVVVPKGSKGDYNEILNLYAKD